MLLCRSCVRSTLIVCAGLLLAATAAARDLYVNNLSGDDTLSGLKPAVAGDDGPVRTIGRALRLAQKSDRVLVANTGVPYREQVSLSGPCHQGSERRPFVLRSDGAVIDGTVRAAAGAWRPVAGDVFALRPRRLRYQQLFRDAEPLKRVRLAGWQGVESALQPLTWSLTDRELLFRVEKDRLPEQYNLRHAGLQTGLTLYDVRHAVVEGFVVQGFQQDGVNAHELACDCVLRGIESRANGRSGLSVGGVSRVAVENCRFYDNGAAQVRTEGLAKLALVGGEVAASEDGAASDFDHRGRELTVDGNPVLR